MSHIVIRLPLTFLLALWLAGSLGAAEPDAPTLRTRLAAYQHVSVNWSGESAWVRVYTAKQQERNLARRDELTKIWERTRIVVEQLRTATGEERARLVEENRRLDEELGRLRPRELERDRGTFYTLGSVGQDYLELKSTDGKETIWLLPLHKVASVVLPMKDSEEPAKN